MERILNKSRSMLFGKKKSKDDASLTFDAARDSDRQSESFYAGEDSPTTPTNIRVYSNRTTISSDSPFRKPTSSPVGYSRSSSFRNPDGHGDSRSLKYGNVSQPLFDLHINPIIVPPPKTIPPVETASSPSLLDRLSISPNKQRGVFSQENSNPKSSTQRCSKEGQPRSSKTSNDQPNTWVRSRRYGMHVDSQEKVIEEVKSTLGNFSVMANPSGNEEDSTDSSVRSSPTNFSVPSSNNEHSTISSASQENPAADPRTFAVSTPSSQRPRVEVESRRGPSPPPPPPLTLQSNRRQLAINSFEPSILHKPSLSADNHVAYRDLAFPLPRRDDSSRTTSLPLQNSLMTNGSRSTRNVLEENNGTLDYFGPRPNHQKGDSNSFVSSTRGRLVKELETPRSIRPMISRDMIVSSPTQPLQSHLQSETTKPLVLRTVMKASQTDKRLTMLTKPFLRLSSNNDSLIMSEGGKQKTTPPLQARSSNDQLIMHSSSSLPTPPMSSNALSFIANGSEPMGHFPSQTSGNLPSHWDKTIGEIINKQNDQDKRLDHLSGQVKTIMEQLAAKESTEARRWSHFEHELRGLRWLILDNIRNHHAGAGAGDSVEAILGAYSDEKENVREGVFNEENPLCISKDTPGSSKTDSCRKRFGLAIDMTYGPVSSYGSPQSLPPNSSESSGNNVNINTLARIKAIQQKARANNLNRS